MGIEGLLGDQPPASGSVLSLGSGKVARGNQEKVRLPAESTRHLFSSQQQQRRGKCSKQVHKREERAGVFFLPFPFSACPSASVGLVSGIPAPSLLPHTVCLCLSVCLSCFLYVPSPPPPILLKSCSLGTGTITLWHRISAQPLGPAGQTYFPACARPARAKWLNLQPVFLSHSIAVAQGFGQKGPRVTAPLRGPPAGGRREEGEALFATDAPDPWKALRQLFSISEK